MASLNKALLMGNLTRDPEMKYTPSGTAVCEFGIALNRKYKSGDDWKEETTFVDITTFGRQAETCNEYLRKGRAAFVEGHLKFDTWETNDGQKRSRLSVIADRVQFLGGRGDSGQSRGAPRTDASAPDDTQKAPDDTQKASDDDDNIPF